MTESPAVTQRDESSQSGKNLTEQNLRQIITPIALGLPSQSDEQRAMRRWSFYPEASGPAKPGGERKRRMNWYIEVLKKYAVFDGRARRMEYWMFVLFNVIISIVLGVIDNVLGTVTEIGQGLLGLVYSLGVLLPGIAVTIRRLHDTGRSGWYILLGFIPCIGAIILLVFMVQDSDAGDNEYGPNPIGVDK